MSLCRETFRMSAKTRSRLLKWSDGGGHSVDSGISTEEDRKPPAGGPGAWGPGRGRWPLAVWAVLVLASALLALVRLDDFDVPSPRVPGSPSAHAAGLLARGMPRLGDEQVMLAFTSPVLRAGDEPYRDAVLDTARALTARPRVGGALPVPEQPDQDPHHAYLVLGVNGDQRQRQHDMPVLRDEARRAAAHASRGRVTVSLVGLTAVASELTRTDIEDLRRAEAVTVPLALLLLAIGLGSLGSALVPLLVAGAGVTVGVGALSLLSLVTDVDTLMLAVTTTVGFGLGLDYALLILVRYRRARTEGAEPWAAVAYAVATAGKAVRWCALAVLLASAALLAVPLAHVRTTGLAALTATGVTYAAAATLLPRVLPRVDPLLAWGVLPGHGRPSSRVSAGWASWARRLMRAPWPFLLAALAVLGVAAAPALGMRLGVHVDRRALAHSDMGHGMARMERDHVTSGSVLALPHAGTAGPVDTAALAEGLRTDPRVAFTATFDNGRDLTAFVVGQRVPVDSAASAALVHDVRSLAEHTLSRGRPVLVGGAPSALTELRAALLGALRRVVPLVLAVSFVLLAAVFRSVLIPLKAIVMNLLSVAAALGLLTAWAPGGEVDYVIPLLAFTIVFGLSMDYEVFLVHAITEHYRGTGDSREAVVRGLSRTARPISLAAGAMAVVFAGLITAGRQDIRQLGFAVSVAVLLDATLIRMVVVPTLMRLMGHRNWWLPRPLARFLPPVHAARPTGGHPYGQDPQGEPNPRAYEHV
ncbi:hypothetical protein CTZ27_22895 [Streptomyces griseocarneus]|nr:hypothetical protein CTZ27_22895 [Streptomyces griseocarneus]